MLHVKNCNFSFSGLKAAASREMERLIEVSSILYLDLKIEYLKFGPLDEQTKANFADAFQRVAIQHLMAKVSRAITWCQVVHFILFCLIE